MFKMLVNACKVQNDTLKVRLPNQSGLKNMITDKTEDYFLGVGRVYLAKLYKAIVSTGYHGLLQIGELTSGTHPMLACNVHSATNRRKIQIVLYHSKTHTKANYPQKIEITSMNTTFKHCPYRIMEEFIKARWKYRRDDEPFLIFRDGIPVKPKHFRAVLSNVIKSLGLDPTLHDPHCLHIGKATDLFKAGHSIESIKMIGCWHSNAKKKLHQINTNPSIGSTLHYLSYFVGEYLKLLHQLK